MKLSIFRSKKGYSLPELLMASAIILMISSIVLAGIKAFSEQRQKVNTIHLALSLQNSVLTGIKDLENYPEETQSILKIGTEEYKKLLFNSSWRSDITEVNFDRKLFTIGENVSFNLKKEALPLDDPKGVIRLYTQIKKIPKSAALPMPRYKIGYRIVFADSRIPHLGSALTMNQPVDEFRDGDFIETIPHEFYMGKTRGSGANQGLVQCDPNIDIGIHGFHRDTGAPICIEKIYGDVPPKSFPRNTSFVEGAYSDDALGIKPHISLDYVRFRTFRAPRDYIYQKIDTLAFDPAGPPSGIRYVFIYQKNVPFFPGNDLRDNITTAKCPRNFYNAQGSAVCKILQKTPIPGTCEVTLEDGTTTTEECGPYNCSEEQLIESNSGSVYTCTYVPPTCEKGSYKATLEVVRSSNNCQINVPETKDSL